MLKKEKIYVKIPETFKEETLKLNSIIKFETISGKN